MLEVDVARALADLKALAAFGRHGTGVHRRALSAEDLAARAWLLARMLSAGLEARIDGVGNVIGRTPGARRLIVIGSHTDTVPNGGWLDGAMGVIFGLELARTYVAQGIGADIGIEVASFNDEEGRFVALLGSGVYCGTLDPAEIGSARADNGESFADALAAAGYAGRGCARFEPGRHIAYLEPHIEQGPVLEHAATRIGIVTGIVGVARARVRFTGQADHAGTTPMRLRRDAGAAAFEFAVRFAEFCRTECGPGTVWNLGHARIEPGAYNVVPSAAELYVEYRDGTVEVLDRIRGHLPALARQVAHEHRVEACVGEGVNTVPAAMHAGVMSVLEAAAGALGASSMRMPSGAGHDAMRFAPLVPTGMLFVPSTGGRSHDVAEDTPADQIGLGLEVFAAAVGEIIARGAVPPA